MLPQWALDLCRPVVGVLSRLLWGVRCDHLEYIPLSGGLIIASNHQTYLDLPVTIRGGHRVWPNTVRFPRLKRGVEIIYHPLFIIEQREDEETRECARRETERLAEIVRSAL